MPVDESDSSPQSNKGKSNPSTPKNCGQKASFDTPSNGSNSLKGSFSEVGNHQGTATLYPGNSLRISEDSTGKFLSPSSFRNLPKFKSAQEMKLPTSPTRLNEKISSETLIMQRINLIYQNEEDLGEIFDESSPSSAPKNFPIQSPGIQKHPNQRI